MLNIFVRNFILSSLHRLGTTRQPYEIIRAAKQIKANKLPDSLVAQIASSIIASNAQFIQVGSAVSNSQKRHGSDKGGPPIKRQVSLF